MPDLIKTSFAIERRRFLQAAGVLGTAIAPAWAGASVNLDLPGGPDERDLTIAFPQKGQMILQRSRPPLLETPFDVFDRGVRVGRRVEGRTSTSAD